ncbi:hypothetical protein A4A49_10749 [Nicotiana attenuata]|uniref:Uncharacterized protein n=1 Tax=Nicotiana attenuata TaxID=49451 RepID=A0A1J6J7K6_NICAT|nr:hypothetical protein A4A49_10749 [Nicotiana attenuata]
MLFLQLETPRVFSFCPFFHSSFASKKATQIFNSHSIFLLLFPSLFLICSVKTRFRLEIKIPKLLCAASSMSPLNSLHYAIMEAKNISEVWSSTIVDDESILAVH